MFVFFFLSDLGTMLRISPGHVRTAALDAPVPLKLQPTFLKTITDFS